MRGRAVLRCGKRLRQLLRVSCRTTMHRRRMFGTTDHHYTSTDHYYTSTDNHYNHHTGPECLLLLRVGVRE